MNSMVFAYPLRSDRVVFLVEAEHTSAHTYG
jgi:hypothetical protein